VKSHLPIRKHCDDIRLTGLRVANRAHGEYISPAYYTVRVDPLDGNIAWSSPAWLQNRSPEPNVPGRVVCR
jgi:hypothetical protein